MACGLIRPLEESQPGPLTNGGNGADGSGLQCASLTHYVPRRLPSFGLRLTSVHGKKYAELCAQIKRSNWPNPLKSNNIMSLAHAH